MKFGWINAIGGAFVVLMLIPNIIYAVKNKGEKNLCDNRLMNILEQVGRYACIVLMWLPLIIGEFGFSALWRAAVYTGGNGILITVYLVLFAVYLKNKNQKLAPALAAIPACVFLLSGIMLSYFLLIFFAIVFGAGHIYVTVKNIKAAG